MANKTEINKLLIKIKMQRDWIKEIEQMKGNQFTPMVYNWNLDILSEMEERYRLYVKENGES